MPALGARDGRTVAAGTDAGRSTGCPLPDASTYELRAEARVDRIASVRTFAAAVARAHDVDEDVVADVRLALSELAGSIAAVTPGVTLELSVSPEEGILRYSLGPWDQPAAHESDIDAWELVTALFDEVTLGEHRIEVSVPRALAD